MTTEKLCEDVFLNIMESIKPERMFGGVSERSPGWRGRGGGKHTREDLFPKNRNQIKTLCNVFIEKELEWEQGMVKRGKKLQRNVGGDKSCFGTGLKGLNKEPLAKWLELKIRVMKREDAGMNFYGNDSNMSKSWI